VIFHAGFGILSYEGQCADRVRAARRDYARSACGRWRSRGQVLTLLCAQCIVAATLSLDPWSPAAWRELRGAR
jgi:hypothetical protein